MRDEAEGLVGINEGARILDVSRRTIYTYINENKLSLVKKRNRSFLKLDEINQLQELKKRKTKRVKTSLTSGKEFDSEKFMIIEKTRYEELLTRLARLASEASDLAEKQMVLIEALRSKRESLPDRILKFFMNE
ncbi:MAG: helix-turn-helix domain-containing protein [Deltaproteobacteria bacterium]|nr:helix-turn-helix domain-containing protein [Deltaproteobacteria bacterium]MBW2053674.1 helix-turn-helix domain-containing protein [Deltaproteobacteria bacterium]MBW2141980.1 helix-turn-helix domain-containing protein [Deltaproteobacteria bacterium]MBW2324400.1 helix-turn-helix domain-containing protein [Deltaproteobacteria bacterium]